MIDDEDAKQQYIEHQIKHREALSTEYTPPPQNVQMWRVFLAVSLLNLNGTQKAVLACLVDHANPHTGRCDPGQSRISEVLDIPLRTVQRAIADLLITPFLRAERRGLSVNNAYHIQWGRILRIEKDYRNRRHGGSDNTAS